MTIYELASSFPPDQLDHLDRAGLLSKTLRRDMQLYERFTEALGRGLSRMEAYAEVSRRLSDLGFSNGMSITVVSSGLRGRGPYAVRLGRATQFALRRAEALKVQCRAA